MKSIRPWLMGYRQPTDEVGERLAASLCFAVAGHPALLFIWSPHGRS